MMKNALTWSLRASRSNCRCQRLCYSSPAIAMPTVGPIDERELRTYARKKQTKVGLKSLMETGAGSRLEEFEQYRNSSLDNISTSQKIAIQIACFLHRELPIRVAHRVVEMQSSSLFLKSPSIRSVIEGYKSSFVQLVHCPAPLDVEKESYFAKMISIMYDRHSSTLITMAKGAHELRGMLNEDIDGFALQSDIQQRLEDFYMSRIGIRMLIGQYLSLKEQPSSPDMIGFVSLTCSPHEIARDAIDDAHYICQRTHGEAPEVTIHGRTDLTFPYVPSHLKYMLVEILKNSMRATVETHGVDKMPPIRIIIADGVANEDVVIKISDEGGGIKRSDVNKIWSYLFTTANPKVLEAILSSSNVADNHRDTDRSSPLAGLGYGLPIARNYARYFGGDIQIMSMEGYGTDCFIYLPRLGDQSILKSDRRLGADTSLEGRLGRRPLTSDE